MTTLDRPATRAKIDAAVPPLLGHFAGFDETVAFLGERLA